MSTVKVFLLNLQSKSDDVSAVTGRPYPTLLRHCRYTRPQAITGVTRVFRPFCK